jgi:PAS domain S-box-containing protein
MVDDSPFEQRSWEGEMFRLLVENVKDYAIFVVDGERRVQTWSKGAERLLGYREDEIVGQSADRFFTPEDRAADVPLHEMRKALEMGRSEDDRWHLRKDNSRFWVSGVLTLLRDKDGTLCGFAKIMRDQTEWKRVEERLRQSEERKAAILQTALDCIITMDHEGKVIEFNPAAEKMFGYRREQVIGRELSDLIIPPSLRERHRLGLAHYLATGEGPVLNRRIEMPALRADGVEFPIELAITRIPTEGPPLFTAYLRDISERIQTEARRSVRLAVTQVLEQAATVAEAASGVLQAICEGLDWDLGFFWIHDRDADVLRCQAGWCQPGLQAAEFEATSHQRTFVKGEGLPGHVWATGKPAWIHDVLYDPNFPRIAIAAREGLHAAFGCPIVVAAATVGVIEFFSRQIREPDADLLETMGSVAGQIGQFVERTEAEEQLRHSEQVARFLADASASLSSVVDYESTLGKVAQLAVPFFADWCIVDMVEMDGSLRRLAVVHGDPSQVAWANEVHRRYPPRPDDPYGPPHVLRTGQAEMAAEITDAILTEAAQDDDHLRMLRQLNFRSYLAVPLSAGGKTLGVITFITSESERRYNAADLTLAEDLAHRAAIAIDNARLYTELRESDRRKDEFLATLAHELRNPLAPIRNALHILKTPTVDAAVAERSREMMERQVHHLVRLVDDLLDVSRVMRGKIELRTEQVDIASLLARAVETAQPLLEAQGHQLTVRLPSEALLVEADPVRLAQVFANLLTNAAKYTEANGHIELTAQRDGEQALLRVRDNGIGISADMLPRIFALFVQADPTTTRAQGGLGIGLTLVKSLVEMHHGSVEAHSEGLGKGSEFVVRLPLATARRQELATQETLHDQRPVVPFLGRRLLVVDDNKDAADSLATMLRLQGHEVRVVHSGAAALKTAASYRPDLVLLDIGMPGMDGYEVARRLRQQPGLENLRLAALTGWGQQQDRRRSAEAGFDHHLVKPVEPKTLEKLLADLKPRDS